MNHTDTWKERVFVRTLYCAVSLILLSKSQLIECCQSAILGSLRILLLEHRYKNKSQPLWNFCTLMKHGSVCTQTLSILLFFSKARSIFRHVVWNVRLQQSNRRRSCTFTMFLPEEGRKHKLPYVRLIISWWNKYIFKKYRSRVDIEKERREKETLICFLLDNSHLYGNLVGIFLEIFFKCFLTNFVQTFEFLTARQIDEHVLVSVTNGLVYLVGCWRKVEFLAC